MIQDFELPPRSQQFADQIDLQLKEAQVKDNRETVTVEKNGESLHVDVVSLPLKDLFYNPGTHRIRAQSSHDPVKEKELKDAPWATPAQDYLGSLLKAAPGNPLQRDPDFERLKEDLQKYGQNDPGLITRQGILVNGNTRAAALREIGVADMRVGVLPESFTWNDINAVELALQLRPDHRRDYTYINHLLALEEMERLGTPQEKIARVFRIKPKTLEQDRWILRLIRDQIGRSRTGGASLRLVDFEDAKERFKELHREYTKLAKTDQDAAEILKESRVAAIMLGFSKTDVRFVEGNFQDDYLSDKVPEGLRYDEAGDSGPAEVAVPGLGVAVPKTSSRVEAARELSRKVLQTRARSASGELPAAERESAEALKQEAREAFDHAISNAGRDVRLRKRKQQVPERLLEACSVIDLCVDELVKARGSRSLDEEAFDEAAASLRKSVQRLARQAGRGNEFPGEGVSWLIEAANVEVSS